AVGSAARRRSVDAVVVDETDWHEGAFVRVDVDSEVALRRAFGGEAVAVPPEDRLPLPSTRADAASQSVVARGPWFGSGVVDRDQLIQTVALIAHAWRPGMVDTSNALDQVVPLVVDERLDVRVQ